MKYHPVDFDIDDFLLRIQGNKPPFICPAESCQKVHKSFAHMQKHMMIHRPPAPIDIPATPSDIQNSLKRRSCLKHGNAGLADFLNFNKAASAPLDPRFSVVFGPSSVTEGQTYRCSVFVPFRIEVIAAVSGRMNINPGAGDNESSCRIFTKRSSSNTIVNNVDRSVNGVPMMFNSTGTVQQKNHHKDSSNGVANLPKAVFEIDPEFRYKKPMEISEDCGYIRFIEKTAEELDEVVEYDLDEEDLFWLERVNKQRVDQSLNPVSEETLEWIMDRFEKEAKFRLIGSSSNDIAPYGLPASGHSGIDDDAVCSVCQDGTCENTNVILFCDVCNLAVHQECYGVPYVPEGPWLCRKCLHSPSEPVSCVLCPNSGGAFKKTTDDRWAHVICGLWVPEVMFANLTFLEPLEGIDKIAPARWRLQCFICKQRNAGACIQCHKTSCYRAFHVTCAQSAGLYMKIEHTDEPGDMGIRKNAFCDQHCPPNHFKSANKGMYANSDSESPQSPEQAARIQLRKARKALAERRNSKPSICVPIVPKAKMDLIASKLTDLSGDTMSFLSKAYGFWKLKREFRRGVPLLKRLQASSLHRTAANFAVAATSSDSEAKKMREQLQFWQQLRQDLEKARLLSELIRKRERAKRELFRSFIAETEILIQPFNIILLKLLDSLQALDKNAFFSEPVAPQIAPDYHLIIKHPMDLSTMRSKVVACSYDTFTQFEADFRLIIENCSRYNHRNSVYCIAATQLSEHGGKLIRDTISACQRMGISSLSDMLHGVKPSIHPAVVESTEKSKPRTVSSLSGAINADRHPVESLDSNPTPNKPQNSLKTTITNTSVSSSTRSRLRSASNEDKSSLFNGYLNPIDLPSRRSRKRRLSAGSPDTTDDARRPVKVERLDDEANKQNGHGEVRNGLKYIFDTGISGVNSSIKSVQWIEKQTSSGSNLMMNRCDSKSNSSLSVKVGRNGPAFTNYRVTQPLRCDDEEDEDSSELETSDESSSLSLSPQIPRSRRRNLGSDHSSKPVIRTTVVGRSRLASSIRHRERIRVVRKAKLKKPPNPPLECRPHSASDNTTCLKCPRRPGVLPKARAQPSSPSSNTIESTEMFTHLESPGPLSVSTSIEPQEFFPPSLDVHSLPGSPTSRSRVSSVNILDSSNDRQLGELDVVWAKCRGSPWYPAIIVDPNAKEGYSHNGVPVPVPPESVLKAGKHLKPDDPNLPYYLVLFFDNKRTWQWLPRFKLQSLGRFVERDRERLKEAKRSKIKHSVIVAYHRAVEHLCKVYGRPYPYADSGRAGELSLFTL